jgi:hypothetical protein
MSDMLDGVIVGAAAAAIGTIIAVKFLNRTPPGGGTPAQPNIRRSVYQGQMGDYVVSPVGDTILPDPNAAPGGGTTPIAEAAFSNPTSQLIEYAPATGFDTNRATEEALLPI